MGYEELLSKMIDNNREARNHMNFSSNPKILRYTEKTDGICPFTQWYCNPACALAVYLSKDEWSCSLNKNRKCHKIN